MDRHLLAEVEKLPFFCSSSFQVFQGMFEKLSRKYSKHLGPIQYEVTFNAQIEYTLKPSNDDAEP